MFGRGDITVNILNNIYIYTQPDLTTKGECVFGRGKCVWKGDITVNILNILYKLL